MESLPIEITEKILLPLSAEDILNFCKSNVVANKICMSRQFWINKLDYDFAYADIYPSVYVDPRYDDGPALYKLFVDGMELGSSTMLERGYLKIAYWLFKRGHNIGPEIYERLNLGTQMNECEWLLVQNIFPDEEIINDQVDRQNTEFLKLLLKYNVDLKLGANIMEYFTVGGEEPAYTDPLLDLDLFELFIQNGIFPLSYLGVISNPKYVSLLERYGISPYKTIQYTNTSYRNIGILENLLEHGVFPPNARTILGMMFNDKGVAKRLMLISKFVPIIENPDFRIPILSLAAERGLLDVVEWYAQHGFIPDQQSTDNILTSLSRHISYIKISYRTLEWLLQHGVYPSTKIVDQISNNLRRNYEHTDHIMALKAKRILIILSEYGIYPTPSDL